MGEIQKTTKDIKEAIDNITGRAELGIDLLFSPVDEEAVQLAEERMKKSKKVCKVIGIVVFVICVIIVYIHLKG